MTVIARMKRFSNSSRYFLIDISFQLFDEPDELQKSRIVLQERLIVGHELMVELYKPCHGTLIPYEHVPRFMVVSSRRAKIPTL